MNKPVDPRTLGYNYGAPLPERDLPAIYHEMVILEAHLREEATAASRKAWALSELLRSVRLSCNVGEREYNMGKVREYVRRNDASFGGTAAGDHATLATI